MEDRIRPKTSSTSKNSSSRVTGVASIKAKSVKSSPLKKRKVLAQIIAQNPLSKDSSRHPIPQQDPNLRLHTGVPHHRRVRSDPIPSSPYSLDTKPSKILKIAKKPPEALQKSTKSHRRANSDGQKLSKAPSSTRLPLSPNETPRESIIDSIKNAFKIGLPLTTQPDFYRLGKPLGKGAFGKVYLGIHKLTGLKVAVKTIEKSFMQDERTRKKVFQEVYIMNKIHDKNVIRLLELFESPKHLMIVLEYAGGGDLLQLLRTRGRISEQEARPIFKQVVDAVIACHTQDIIHRDIKLDNILLNEEMTLIKLCDFGVSRVAKHGLKISEQCGTPAYLAPEIIVNEGYEPFFVDVWSMGILIYALLSATVPFKAKTIAELHKIILRGKYEFPEYFSEQIKDLIREMLNPVPHLRIKLHDLKQHEWFNVDTLDSSFHSTKDSNNEGRHANIVDALGEFGFPREFVENCLKKGEINHATASYNVLDINMFD